MLTWVYLVISSRTSFLDLSSSIYFGWLGEYDLSVELQLLNEIIAGNLHVAVKATQSKTFKN